jgi:hypothetical protein
VRFRRPLARLDDSGSQNWAVSNDCYYSPTRRRPGGRGQRPHESGRCHVNRPPSRDHSEFVKLTFTIRDPRTAHPPQYTLNLNRFLCASLQNTEQLRIVRPPGSRLRSLADVFCSPKTMKRGQLYSCRHVQRVSPSARRE